TLSRLTTATLLRFGSPDALSIPASCFNRTAAGGVFVINVNERSSNTVISTGIIKPTCSCVCALNSLQNPIILIPACPSAGLICGSGFAFPAGICNFTMSITFLATKHTSLSFVMWYLGLLTATSATLPLTQQQKNFSIDI